LTAAYGPIPRTISSCADQDRRGRGRRGNGLPLPALFSLISARYQRGNIILTSNKGFAEWGEVLGDSVIATAVLDRLLHHSHVPNIRGESYRLREKKRAGFLGTVQPQGEVEQAQ